MTTSSTSPIHNNMPSTRPPSTSASTSASGLLSAFATPLPATAPSNRSCFALHVTCTRRFATRTLAPRTSSSTLLLPPTVMTASLPPPSPSSSEGAAVAGNSSSSTGKERRGVWNGIRRVVRMSALSATLLFAPGVHRPCGETVNTTASPVVIATTLPRLVRPASAAAASASAASSATATTSSSSSSSNASDVEAAAMTLGAVTLGGLVMRAIINRSRDEKADVERLQAECARLEEEERDRARRADRRRLETVEASELDGDDDLWSELRKRVDDLEDAGGSGDGDSTSAGSGPGSGAEGSAADGRKDDMRHSPIPDRGTGSALLDRPQGGDGGDGKGGVMGEGDDGQQDTKGGEEDNVPVGDNLEKADDLEMLKRMWNMSPPEKE